MKTPSIFPAPLILAGILVSISATSARASSNFREFDSDPSSIGQGQVDFDAEGQVPFEPLFEDGWTVYPDTSVRADEVDEYAPYVQDSQTDQSVDPDPVVQSSIDQNIDGQLGAGDTNNSSNEEIP